MKKNLILIAGIWAALIVLTFVTAPDLGIGERILYTFVFAVIAWIGIKLGVGQKKTGNSSKKNVQYRTDKEKYTYIFRGMERQFLYRYDGKYIYQGMSDKFIYRVENNKIYKGMDSKFSYRMEGNKIYRGLERQPLYRIDGNNIYSGDFGRQPVYRMSSSISI